MTEHIKKNLFRNLFLYLTKLVLLTQAVQALYSATPKSVFGVVQPTSLFIVPVVKLSPTGGKLAISYFNTTSLTLSYKIVTLQGQQQCKRQHTEQTRLLIAWPRNYGLMFLANDNLTVNYFTQQCDQMEKLVKFQKRPYKVVTTFRQPNNSIVTFAYQNPQQINMVLEYFMRDKFEFGRYYGWVDDTIKTISYSDDSQILFISGSFSNQTVNYTWQQIKVKSNLKYFQINTTLVPKKVINNNYECIGLINNDTYVRMDENNNTKIIHTLQANEKQGGICTRDDVLVILRFINLVQKIDILIYSTEDGSLLQTIPLDFIPVPIANPLGGGKKFIQCDSDSLVLLGGDGMIRVYQYQYGFVMPIWGIVLISIIGAIVILTVACCFCNKRKKSKKRSQLVEQYSNLTN